MGPAVAAVQLSARTWQASRVGAALSLGRVWTIRLIDASIDCRSSKRRFQISLNSLAGVEIKSGLFWSRAVLASDDGRRLSISGLRNAQARIMALELIRASCAARARLLATEPSPFFAWAKLVEQLHDSAHWISFDEIERSWRSRPAQSAIGLDLEALDRDLRVHSDLRIGVAPCLLDALTLTKQELVTRAHDHNERFAASEEANLASYFHEVEKSPLSVEQIRACLCFDNRVLVVAAAGSGKTSTMVAKSGYALLRGIVRPDEILMLAFNADAAKELGRRLGERLGPLEVGAEYAMAMTFHKLGLEIIGKVTGRKPRVAPWIEMGQDVETVAEIMKELSGSDSGFAAASILFRMVLSRDLAPFDVDPGPEDWDGSAGRAGFRTMRGDVVKSQEERLIADWLFFNGVSYEYERKYEFDTATPEHGQYKPDFYYPDAKAYHEHFGLDEQGRPPKHFGDQYLEGVEWKRSCHLERGTKLIETTSFGIRDGNDLERLQAELESFGIRFQPDPDREVPGRPPASDLELARKLRAFMIHAKNNRSSIEILRSRITTSRSKGFRIRERTFLSLYEKVATAWDRRLREGEYVDFEDMLNLATELVASGKWSSPFRLVMIDEFQDVSKSRVDLVKALVRGEDRFLFAVGDDWQAINRFAGADVAIMGHFEESFGPSNIHLLQETWRSPQLLCDVAGDFVSRNPAQIRKAVISAQPVFREPVQVYFCDEASRESMLEKHLQALYDKVGSTAHPARPDGTVTALMLGRYNADVPARWRQWRDGFGDRIRLEFSTIHSAKGLEADYVFLVRMSAGRGSFPSTIEDDPILLLAMPVGEDFLFAEERRLFYVALTRARRQVVIYCDERMPSPFIEELKQDERVVFRGSTTRSCPSCKTGFVVRREGPFSAFFACSRFPRCLHREPIRDVQS